MTRSIDPILVDEPREALDIEVKEWLDLTSNDHKAVVARSIIALANHGGGHLVIGFKEQADGSFTADPNRPSSVNYAQDAIQSIVSKYIDPAVQCSVVTVVRKSDGLSYPVVAVPGGQIVPVRAKSGSPNGKLVPHRVYTRRAGPASEEPQTAEEWDRVLDRCLKNRKSELLDALRAIMAGEIPTAQRTEPLLQAEFKAFTEDARLRWSNLVADLPSQAAARMPHGHIDLAFALDQGMGNPTLTQLHRAIFASFQNHSGWPPFVALTRVDLGPQVVDGAIEAWLGERDGPAHHSDYWRIDPRGFFFTRMGLREDGEKGEPGRLFDINWTFLRFAEALLEVSYLADALDVTAGNVSVDGQIVGLKGRKLVAIYSNRMLGDWYTSKTDRYSFEVDIAVTALRDSLPEIVWSEMRGLYEAFSLYELPKRMVEVELERLRNTVY